MTLDDIIKASIKVERMKRENERMISQIDRNIARIQEARRKTAEYFKAVNNNARS